MDKKFTNEKIINVAKCCITGNCKSCPLKALISRDKNSFELEEEKS